MGSCIWIDTEAHVWIWVKLRFGLAGEIFLRESQSYMIDLRRIGWIFLAFLGMEGLKGMLSKIEGFSFLCAGFGGGCVNLRID